MLNTNSQHGKVRTNDSTQNRALSSPLRRSLLSHMDFYCFSTGLISGVISLWIKVISIHFKHTSTWVHVCSDASNVLLWHKSGEEKDRKTKDEIRPLWCNVDIWYRHYSINCVQVVNLTKRIPLQASSMPCLQKNGSCSLATMAWDIQYLRQCSSHNSS